jgi:hypothetical protein
MHDDKNEVADQAQEPVATIEELELEWWEPLGCKCDVSFEE